MTFELSDFEGLIWCGPEQKVVEHFDDMLSRFAPPGTPGVVRPWVMAADLTEACRSEGLAALAERTWYLPTDVAVKKLHLIRSAASLLPNELRMLVLGATLVADARLVGSLAGDGRSRDALAHFDEVLSRCAPAGTDGVHPRTARRSSLALSNWERSASLAELALQTWSLPGDAKANRFCLVANACQRLTSEGLKGPVLAALGNRVSGVPDAHQGRCFDRVLHLTLQLPADLQLPVFIEMAKDIEHLGDRHASRSFDMLLTCADNLPDELRARVLTQLAKQLPDVPLPCVEPTRFDQIARRNDGSLVAFVGPVTHRYEACLSLLQRAGELTATGQDTLLCQLADLDLFDGTPEWTGQMLLAILAMTRGRAPAACQLDTLANLARWAVAVKPEAQCFLTLWEDCEELGAALLERLQEHARSEAVVKRLNGIGRQLQERVFPRLADDAKEAILSHLETQGTSRVAGLRRLPDAGADAGTSGH